MTDTVDGRASLLASAVRRRIVEHLAGLPPLALEGQPTRSSGMTAAELGEVLGLHQTTVRFHLDQLVAGGIVEAHFVRAGRVGRPSKRYFVAQEEVPVESSPQVGPYQVLAGLLAGALDPAGERPTPEEAGRRWVRERLGAVPAVTGSRAEAAPAATTGEWLAAVGGVVDLLEEWGYFPDLEVDGRQGDAHLVLRDCPFLDLARVRPEVVCGVHRGLLRGALEMAGESGARVTLQPFTGPRTCQAHLRRDRDRPSDRPTDPTEPLPTGTDQETPR